MQNVSVMLIGTTADKIEEILKRRGIRQVLRQFLIINDPSSLSHYAIDHTIVCPPLDTNTQIIIKRDRKHMFQKKAKLIRSTWVTESDRRNKKLKLKAYKMTVRDLIKEYCS